LKNKISILGCGWLGTALAKNLINLGYDVKGSTTSLKKIEKLNDIGIQPFIFDISKKESYMSEFLSSEILIVSITSKNINDFKFFIKQVELSIIKNIIFISSTSVYPSNNQVVTEESFVEESSLLQIENLFRSNNLNVTILRFGGLVGYNRNPGKFHSIDRLIKDPEGFVNLIHRDDCLSIIEQLINQEIWGEIFNACSDDHPSRREFYTKKRKEVGIENSLFIEGANLTYKKVNSSKLKQHLNFRFKHPNLMTTFD
tara:strand:+ start:105 stop:875 length:771 start_codon:yes stop_codon:yes gene_type:complete